ncbi:MAG: glycosyltransferase [Ardenticatenaceae bacterium]
MIRVLQLITGLAIGEQVGGAELFAVQLARHLDRKRFEPAIFGLWQYDSASEQAWVSTLRQEGIETHFLANPTGHLLSDLRHAFSALWSLIGEFEPHIINSHSERTDLFNALTHLFHPVDHRSVRTMHTNEQWQDRPWLGALMLHMVFPLLFNSEVAISEATRLVLDRRPAARLLNRASVLCYNGIDAALLSYSPHPMADALPPYDTPNPIRIGIVGRLTEQKGHRDLLQAMKLVHQVRSAHLLVIGSGPLCVPLQAYAKQLGIAEFVHFLGSRHDVLDILSLLDLFVSSSLWEGFPTVLLEAMTMGVPVIATNVSGSRELVKTGVTGILVPPRSPNHLAEAILRLLNNPVLARSFAANARSHITQFTIQNTASHYEKLYQLIQNKQ